MTRDTQPLPLPDSVSSLSETTLAHFAQTGQIVNIQIAILQTKDPQIRQQIFNKAILACCHHTTPNPNHRIGNLMKLDDSYDPVADTRAYTYTKNALALALRTDDEQGTAQLLQIITQLSVTNLEKLGLTGLDFYTPRQLATLIRNISNKIFRLIVRQDDIYYADTNQHHRVNQTGMIEEELIQLYEFLDTLLARIIERDDEADDPENPASSDSGIAESVVTLLRSSNSPQLYTRRVIKHMAKIGYDNAQEFLDQFWPRR